MNNLGDEILSTVSGDKDPLTALLSKIPGFKGYIAREERRASDKLLRETISQRFEEQWKRVSDLQQEFISMGEIMYMDDLERAAIKLRTFADRIRTAKRGYSGFFDKVKVEEEDLARLYEYDNAMFALVDEVARAIDNVQASMGTEGVTAAIKALEKTAKDAIETFNRRDEVALKK